MRESELKPVPEVQKVEPATISEPEKKPEFNIQAALTGFSSWVVFSAFNTATLIVATEALAEGLADRPQVVFMTRLDKKVDKKLCRPLNGKRFYADDPAIPRPPLHLHCRCMLIPI